MGCYFRAHQEQIIFIRWQSAALVRCKDDFTDAYWWEQRGDIKRTSKKHRLPGRSLSITEMPLVRCGEGKRFSLNRNINNRSCAEKKISEVKRERCCESTNLQLDVFVLFFGQQGENRAAVFAGSNQNLNLRVPGGEREGQLKVHVTPSVERILWNLYQTHTNVFFRWCS